MLVISKGDEGIAVVHLRFVVAADRPGVRFHDAAADALAAGDLEVKIIIGFTDFEGYTPLPGRRIDDLGAVALERVEARH